MANEGDTPGEVSTKPDDGPANDSFDQILRRVVRGEATPPALSAGTLLDERFTVERLLGAGGMGSVYLARDESLGREVAIKLHHTPGGGHRLKREASAMARLAHPNVVTVYEVGELDGFPFVVMEYVPGTTLRAWLAEEPRTIAAILEMLVAAGAGLAAAHDAGLIHRDIKPENVLIGKDGRARVGDFGLARELTSSDEATDTASAQHQLPSMTQTGAVLGTPAYMAPEQLRGEPIDARVDQFAFCVMAWEVLCGERPYAGRTLPELEDAMRTNTRRAAPAKLPARVRRALERGLASDPRARFASMHELLAALRVPRGRRVIVAVAALAVVAAASTFAFVASRSSSAGPACSEDPALLGPLPLDLPSKLRALGHDGAATQVAGTLDGFAKSVRAQARATCEQLAASSDRIALQHKADTCFAIAVHAGKALLAIEPLTVADVPLIVVRARALPSSIACTSPAFLANVPVVANEPAALAVFVEARRDLELAMLELGDAHVTRAEHYLDRVAASPVADSALVKPALLVARAMAAQLVGGEAAARLASDGYYAARAVDDDAMSVNALALLLSLARDQAIEAASAPGWVRTAVADAERIASRAPRLAAFLYVAVAGVALANDDHAAVTRYAARAHELLQPNQADALAEVLSIEGDVALAAGKITEGKALYERAIAARITISGPDSLEVGLDLNNYASALLDAGAAAEAAARAKRALAIIAPLVGEADLVADDTRITLGASLAAIGDAQGARALLEVVRSHYIGDHTSKTTQLSAADAELARLALDANDTERALELLQEALAIDVELLGPEREEVALVHDQLARAYIQTWDLLRAVASAARAAEIRGLLAR